MTPLVLVVEDHPLFRQAVVDGLARSIPDHRFEQAASIDEARSCLTRDRPALVLLDLELPGVSGLAGLVAILADWPTLPVAILSASAEPQLMTRALAIGARG
jgi:DNA-binding NarL/FixJ family response regulator